MFLRRFAANCLFSALALIALPSVAQGPPSPFAGTIYLGEGRVLDAAPPRQVSLNAHILQILYQPAGLAIAYAGASFDEDAGTATYFVKSVATRKGDKGQTRTLISETVHVGDETAPYQLIGWTSDAHYLIVNYPETVSVPVDLDQPEGPSSPVSQVRFICINVAPDPAHPRPIPLPLVGPAAGQDFAWSPKRSRLLFRQYSYVADKKQPDIVTLYSPARDEATTITLPQERRAQGWLDETHLLLREQVTGPIGKLEFFRYALADGTEEPISDPKPWPVAPDSAFDIPHVSDFSVTAKAPDLRLAVEEHPILDNQRVAAVDSHAIWVRRMGGRPRLSTLPVGLTPGTADPQAQWSPEGNQVAYVAHGDLFVSDLIERDARASEKMAAGERLNCDEERQIVQSDLKQIGLGIIQYVQDYDEKWPPAQGFKEGVMPYIKNESLFHFGDVQFTYIAPPGPSLADMDAPAETIIGEMDTPCGRNVLYADGHVKSFPKQESAP